MSRANIAPLPELLANTNTGCFKTRSIFQVLFIFCDSCILFLIFTETRDRNYNGQHRIPTCSQSCQCGFSLRCCKSVLMDVGRQKINLLNRLSWSHISDHRAVLDNLKLQISSAILFGFIGQYLWSQEYSHSC